MSLWSCTICFKSFSRKGDLTRHKLLHTGIKPHVCETCGKGFAQFSGLKTHRNVHSKDKPYVCGVGTCTKAFGDPSSRTRHRKETHRREGAYKCIVTECGTRIKRRSTFMAHLRKHGLNPHDLEAIVSQDRGSEISAPAHFVSPFVEDKTHWKTLSRDVIPSFLGDSPIYHALGDDGRASHFGHSSEWLQDNPLDCRRTDWFPTNNTLLLGPMTGHTANDGLSGLPHGDRSCLTSDFENPFCFDSIFPTTGADYSLLVASPPGLPILEPFLEARSDGSQSSSPSPLSTYSNLYAADVNDDMVSLSLVNSASQGPLLYSFT